MKNILFKPFEKFSAIQLIIVGLIFTLLGTWFATLYNGRFDGVLDFHIVQSCIKGQAIIDNIINISCLFIFLLIAGKLINPKTRIIDSLSVAIAARIPMYLLPLINSTGSLNFDADPNDLEAMRIYAINNLVPLIIVAIVTILVLVWYIALAYNGFKTASNAKGAKAIWVFIGAILFAEVVSKTIIYLIN